MTTALATTQPPQLDAATIASVLLTGDLEKLNDQQRMSYCQRVCEVLGLNPLTQPFAFIRLNGKLVMYAKKDATEQLRKLHGVSILEVSSQNVADVFVVTAKAQDRSGRTDAATGAVAIGNLKGESLANALMKAETKAKRRVTLSICGLGMLDETEVENIQDPLPTKATQRITLPEGTVQIIEVQPRRKGNVEWADVTFVDHNGAVQTLPLPADVRGAGAALCEQLVQEACPVVITSEIRPRKKQPSIADVKRWEPPRPTAEPTPEENAVIDAELAKQEGMPF